MMEREPLIQVKGNKSREELDQRKGLKDYVDKTDSYHWSKRDGLLVTLCYLLAGFTLNPLVPDSRICVGSRWCQIDVFRLLRETVR